MLLRLWVLSLVIKYIEKVDEQVEATELIIKLKPNVAER